MFKEQMSLWGTSWSVAAAVVAVIAIALVSFFVVRFVANARQASKAPHRLDQLDTLADWPPEGTRLLNSVGLKAHATLLKALPECLIFAQVPLARFVRVPRRQSYSEWITRVGHLAADFLICDKSSLALGVVIITDVTESSRAAKRRDRMKRVLQRAGIRVFIWRGEALPSAASARSMLLQAGPLGDLDEMDEDSVPFDDAVARAPVKSIRSDETDADDADPWSGVDAPREPPASTWFDELDDGHAAAKPPVRRSAMR
jgi:hypothetical protein